MKGKMPLAETKPIIRKQEVREGIQKLQDKISSLPGALGEDPFPLKHSFAHGLYVREITCPAGMLIVTKIHKFSHPVFLLKGDVSILEETGTRRIKAPCSFITSAGTKRVCYTHSETVWTTVHATKETDLEKIEEEIIAKNFDELPCEYRELVDFVKEVKSGELQ